VPWSGEFDDPIELPDGRVLRTRRFALAREREQASSPCCDIPRRLIVTACHRHLRRSLLRL
jgi:hypothetical protein